MVASLQDGSQWSLSSGTHASAQSPPTLNKAELGDKQNIAEVIVWDFKVRP